MPSAPHNVVHLAHYRKARVLQDWPEDWLLAVEPRNPARFTLDWMPAWFELVALVAEERRLTEAQRLQRS